MPEAWLRGPVPGVPAELMPVAHALVDAVDDLARAAADLTLVELWATPGGAPSVGFHLRHASGSTERLFVYARGEQLTAHQLDALSREGNPGDPPAPAAELLRGLRDTLDRALAELRTTSTATLFEAREVGRARLPSSVHGLLFHAAEHARRHAGQAIATARIIRGLDLR